MKDNKKHSATFYQKHKAQVLAEKRVRRERNVQWLVEYKKTLQCSRCPENHPACLDFHHVDPDAKSKGVCRAVTDGWSIVSILAEIAKCLVLCSNCHRKEHF